MDIVDARAWYAEDLRVAAGLTNDAIVAAFARVPRETFIGPPPWRVGTRLTGTGACSAGEYRTFDGDPAVLYHDVVVTLDQAQDINNGLPGLWATMFQQIEPRAGERMLHLGCGAGYYTAILAELAGANGSVLGVEIEPGLAERARVALASWPNTSVTCRDGAIVEAESWDLIVVSAGATHPLQSWLEGLRVGGRLLFPMTVDGAEPGRGSGVMLLVTRRGDTTFAARFIAPVAFIHFKSGRDPQAAARLLQALRKGLAKLSDVHSLRRDPHEEGETCWLHADTFCLSCLDSPVVRGDS
jgi:protein-L-isoaspartate(D-aspartate) O-methyltransferase